MKIYYAYMKNCMEKIDSTYAFTRKTAAKHFAKKKNISIKDWLEIYTVLEQDDFNKYYNKIIEFSINNIIVKYKISSYCSYIQRIDNNHDIDLRPRLKYYKLKSFIQYLINDKWNVEIKEIKEKTRI